ncbi:MAG TPA: hypothetical protein VFW09_15235 [Solirubrobacteraceae bacterium]|nr:hypothetical protein [Solirubrobacteraceae bacterium]
MRVERAIYLQPIFEYALCVRAGFADPRWGAIWSSRAVSASG